MVVCEGGINWNWFTVFEEVGEEAVRILWHDKIHKGSELPSFLLGSIDHPNYYHRDIWDEDEQRVALRYNVPGKGWRRIVNPRYVFDYHDLP